MTTTYWTARRYGILRRIARAVREVQSLGVRVGTGHGWCAVSWLMARHDHTRRWRFTGGVLPDAITVIDAVLWTEQLPPSIFFTGMKLTGQDHVIALEISTSRLAVAAFHAGNDGRPVMRKYAAFPDVAEAWALGVFVREHYGMTPIQHFYEPKTTTITKEAP